MVEAVVFDLFETLVTESQVRPVRASTLGEALGLEREAFKAEWKVRRPSVVLGRLPFIDALTQISRALDGGVDWPAIREAREQRILEKAMAFADVDRQVADMVRTLREQGVRLAVVSNCFAEDVQAWSAWELAGEFQCVVFSWAAGLAKPDPRIYTTATRRLAVRPDASVFIGDGGDGELVGAKQAGLRAFRADWFVQRRPQPGSTDDAAIGLKTCQDAVRLATAG
jgi:putative hydrolase of the HAD superfamily